VGRHYHQPHFTGADNEGTESYVSIMQQSQDSKADLSSDPHTMHLATAHTVSEVPSELQTHVSNLSLAWFHAPLSPVIPIQNNSGCV
jgi:hypothetical protein